MAKFKDPCNILVQMESGEPIRCENVVEAGGEDGNYVIVCADGTWYAFVIGRILYIKSDGVPEEE